jgi:hypothetical protein
MSHRGGGGASRGGGGGGMMAARSMGAARSQGSFRGRGMRGPVGSFPHTFVSTCGAGGCGHEFGFRRRYFDNFVAYPYPYPSYSYTTVPYPIVPLVTNYSVGNSPTYFGSCQAVDGVGVVQNNCWGLVPVPQAGNQCVCYDRTTGVSGCMNVAGAACAPVVPSPYL